jgi:aspartyl aminopeptidase
LAIHGVFVKPDGSKVTVSIGEKDDDPVFFVSDLLIHLADDQMNKNAKKVIEGEELDIIVGNRPVKVDKDAKKDEDAQGPVAQAVLDILKKEYGVEEEDFISAELEVVPAGRAREAGLDRSMILAYGQDDRVCAFSSYKAMLEVESVKRTSCCILVDKEEIGSVGATGMESRFFENTVAELIALMEGYSELTLKRCLANCNMLSSDVSSGYDPKFAASYDQKNVAMLGDGLVMEKFTGSRGKGGSNDANAEYIGHLRSVYAKENVNFQTAELGKVDLGGGGTIAYILALYGMNVIDSGVAVLNMHAPWEATSKADVYEAKRGYAAFLNHAVRL